uniref:DDE_Tnp_1_7 domain-containing protein n=1 Tax=Strongyloides venezuelensis TaxID=75913 RepID=A0A0K0F8N6_STRVS
MSDLERYSFRNRRKLKKFTLHYLTSFITHGSLMPDTVKKLETVDTNNLLSLSSRMTQKLNEYMPNIKMLTFCDRKFKDSDCLSAFKKLEVIAKATLAH